MSEQAVIHGAEPNLSGEICKALICEGYVFQGELVSEAIKVFLQVDTVWHCFLIDAGVVFWRTQEETPRPWAVPEEQWDYPHRNVGAEFGLNGHRILSTATKRSGARVTIELLFDSGARFRLEDENDSTSFSVT